MLLYGSPGTGKMLTPMHLASQIEGRTVILLTGAAMQHIEESCQMARLLQPSTVIIEDVDLIAEERSRQNTNTNSLLFELLNQMDGLAADVDVLFLLTTNRPDILEPALAARPGRIDLAIEVPVPDAAGRGRLFELYGQGMAVRVNQMDRIIDKTERVSPAFVRELMRKAALIAAETNDEIVLEDQQLEDALLELLVEGGELMRSLLGPSHQGRHGQ